MTYTGLSFGTSSYRSCAHHLKKKEGKKATKDSLSFRTMSTLNQGKMPRGIGRNSTGGKRQRPQQASATNSQDSTKAKAGSPPCTNTEGIAVQKRMSSTKHNWLLDKGGDTPKYNNGDTTTATQQSTAWCTPPRSGAFPLLFLSRLSLSLSLSIYISLSLSLRLD